MRKVNVLRMRTASIAGVRRFYLRDDGESVWDEVRRESRTLYGKPGSFKALVVLLRRMRSSHFGGQPVADVILVSTSTKWAVRSSRQRYMGLG